MSNYFKSVKALVSESYVFINFEFLYILEEIFRIFCNTFSGMKFYEYNMFVKYKKCFWNNYLYVSLK